MMESKLWIGCIIASMMVCVGAQNSGKFSTLKSHLDSLNGHGQIVR